jgi:hypothetical protein
MKPGRRSILAMLDDTVRWTGMPARVAAQMSDDPDRKHRPMRWIPIGPIAFSCALLWISLAWPAPLDGVDLAGVIGPLVAFWGAGRGMLPYIHIHGPLGKPSLEDDEREATLRKDSFLFCLGWLAVLNGLGQPCLMILSQWQHWQIAQTTSVVTTAFMLNASLLGCLPTLYASWNLRQLTNE